MEHKEQVSLFDRYPALVISGFLLFWDGFFLASASLYELANVLIFGVSLILTIFSLQWAWSLHGRLFMTQKKRVP